MKRETAVVAVLQNAHLCPPPTGSCVLALTRMGVLISTQWSAKSIEYCDAWTSYPKVPADVKKLMGDRYSVKGEPS